MPRKSNNHPFPDYAPSKTKYPVLYLCTALARTKTIGARWGARTSLLDNLIAEHKGEADADCDAVRRSPGFLSLWPGYAPGAEPGAFADDLPKQIIPTSR